MPDQNFEPIGVLKSCFREKFGAPRQAGMIPSAVGILKLRPDPRFRDALRYLEEFSHVWVIFRFHDLGGEGWRPLISPPRLDAPGRVGVFASRSPHRPNHLGLSALKLDRIDFEAKGGIEIHLSGLDLLDETPVYDLKPYVPYVDCILDAKPGWTEGVIPKFKVSYAPEALQQVKAIAAHTDYPHLMALIEQTMEYDPRPTAQRKALPLNAPESEGLQFAFRILNLDVHWRIKGGGLWIEEVLKLDA